MQVVYLCIPELPGTRHIIAGETHIINTAAPEANVFYRVERRERDIPFKQVKKKTAPR